MSSLHHEVDGRIAEPLAAALDRTGNLVTSVVPPGYERYVRILNPIEFGDGSIMLWSDIVERNGLEASPWMQWDQLKAALALLGHLKTQNPRWATLIRISQRH